MFLYIRAWFALVLGLVFVKLKVREVFESVIGARRGKHVNFAKREFT